MNTIAASTVLITFNWPKGTVRYERTAKFVDAFFSKIDEFHQPPRNPLWKSVNLATAIPGWTRFPAAEEWIEKWRKGNQQSPPQTDQLLRELQTGKSKQN